jgi:hypothetical protein
MPFASAHNLDHGNDRLVFFFAAGQINDAKLEGYTRPPSGAG